jgi:hypothetical protein
MSACLADQGESEGALWLDEYLYQPRARISELAVSAVEPRTKRILYKLRGINRGVVWQKGVTLHGDDQAVVVADDYRPADGGACLFARRAAELHQEAVLEVGL